MNRPSAYPPTVPVSPLRIAVLISGGGTTLRNLLEHIRDGRLDAAVGVVISSNPDSPGLQLARRAGIESLVCRREEFPGTEAFSQKIFERCRAAEVDAVVLGGFLKLLSLPADFANRVLNIHPSLIPSFCGRGYYGLRVHQAVLDYGCKITGCTVHLVDEQYDHGPIILQRCVEVRGDDTAESLQQRVFAEECRAYPEALRLYAAGRLRVEGRRVRILPDS